MVLHFRDPMGIPVFINQLGKSFAKAQRGIMFPPAPVSTLDQWLALFFDATCISTVAKASVIASMEISMRVICFKSSGVFWLACQAYIMTSSKAGSPSETPTPTLSSLFFLHVSVQIDLGFFGASLALLDFLYFCFQWPIFWQA